MPAKAGIHLRQHCKAKESLDSGLRRNDGESASQQIQLKLRQPGVQSDQIAARPSARMVSLSFTLLTLPTSVCGKESRNSTDLGTL